MAKLLPVVLNLALLSSVLLLEGSCSSGNFPWCPALEEECYCRRKYNSEDYIYCENMGNLAQVPDFNQSDILFSELHFRFDTKINFVQRNAFNGLKVEHLWLQNLDITEIDRHAFNGLEDTITHLHLDQNSVSTLHRNAISHLQKLQYLGLHNNLMTSVPLHDGTLQDFPSLHYLYIFNNMINDIPLDTFRGMRLLKGLKLNDNAITYLRTGALDPLVQLKDLELQGNMLTSLPANIFRTLANLTKLDLSRNRIYLLLTEAFYGLESLEALHLDHNLLSEFQRGMFTYIRRLKYLTLSYNAATSIGQTTFSMLRNLRTLDLSYNSITRIETKSFAFHYRLEKLYLQGNHLTHIEFFHNSLLARIETLDLSENNISQLLNPKVFESLSKVEQLDLGSNSLRNLNPGIFRELRLLKVLKLAGNPLYLLREGVLEHLNLEELDMKRCRLRRIDDKAFASISKINYMWLDDNELEDIPTRLFNNTKNLHILSLTNNTLTKLRRDMFKGLSKLEALHVDGNRLANITEYSLVFLGGLKTFTASYNRISELYEHSFNDLKSLVTLDLSHNRISNLGRAFTRFQQIQYINLNGNLLRNVNWFSFYYSTLQNLKRLDLANCDLKTVYLDGLIISLKTPLAQFQLNLVGNPLSCNGCDLSWSRYIPYDTLVSPIDVTCSEPEQFKGKPVLCCSENPCISTELQNNTQIQQMCEAAEIRMLERAQTTAQTTIDVTDDTFTADTELITTQDSPSSLSPEDNLTDAEHSTNSTIELQDTTTEQSVATTMAKDNVISTLSSGAEGKTEGTVDPTPEQESASDSILPQSTPPPSTESQSTGVVNITEIEIGSGEVDKDYFQLPSLDSKYDIKDDVDDETTTFRELARESSYSNPESTTFFALLLTETIETTAAEDKSMKEFQMDTNGSGGSGEFYEFNITRIDDSSYPQSQITTPSQTHYYTNTVATNVILKSPLDQALRTTSQSLLNRDSSGDFSGLDSDREALEGLFSSGDNVDSSGDNLRAEHLLFLDRFQFSSGDTDMHNSASGEADEEVLSSDIFASGTYTNDGDKYPPDDNNKILTRRTDQQSGSGSDQYSGDIAPDFHHKTDDNKSTNSDYEVSFDSFLEALYDQYSDE